MYLVPIVRRTVVEKSGQQIIQCWLLLERNGTHLMSVGSAEEGAAFATENDLTVTRTVVAGDLLFLDIAPMPALGDFYTWAEVAPGQQPMREVWRPFLWSVPDLGSNEALKSMEVGPKSVGDILQCFFDSKV